MESMSQQRASRNPRPLTRSLFGDGIPRSLLLRVSPAKPNFCSFAILIASQNEASIWTSCRGSNQNRPPFPLNGWEMFWQRVIEHSSERLFLSFESEVGASKNQKQKTVTFQRGAEASSSSKRNKCTGNPQLFMGCNGEPKNSQCKPVNNCGRGHDFSETSVSNLLVTL
jgi:hypothetical protein